MTESAPTLWRRGTITLTWPEGHEFHGLEVEMRRRPLGQVIDEWLATGDDAPRADLPMKEIIEQRHRDAANFAALVVRWNLADEAGAPAPITGEGVLSACDQAMISAMWRAYHETATRVAPPLSQSSNVGPVVTPPVGWDMGPQELIDHPV